MGYRIIQDYNQQMVTVGEIYEIDYNLDSIVGITPDLDSIRASLEAERRAKVQSISFNAHNLVTVKIKILQNPLPLALFVYAVITIAAGLFIYLSVREVRLIISEPEALPKLGAIGSTAVLLIGLVLLGFVLLIRGRA